MRARTQRNLLATLALSQGVPMISHGDELGRSQRGNNNAYCHDSELSWLDWNLDEPRRQLLDFTREVFRLRRENPVFRRRGFFSGGSVPRGGGKDVTWVRADGREMTAEDWHDPQLRVLGMLVHGQASDELDERGRPNRGATLLLLVNGGSRARHFALPPLAGAGIWRERVNTARPPAHALRANAVNLAAHSLILLERRRPS
jgi:glycogen operon protein